LPEQIACSSGGMLGPGAWAALRLIPSPRRRWLLVRSPLSPSCDRVRNRKSFANQSIIPMQAAKLIALSVVVAALTAVFAHLRSARAENYLCRQQFALCTSAPCIPLPGNSKVAMCSCDVEDGPNL